MLILNREQRISKMAQDNPGRSLQECSSAADSIREAKKQALLESIPSMYQEATLQDLGYATKTVSDALERIVKADAKDKTCGLVFAGNPGSGKTHALMAIVRHFAEMDPEAISYVGTYVDMMQKLRKEFVQDAYSDYASVWDKLNSDGLVLIDDVSASKPTDFELDKFLSFMSARMDRFFPFILTTNIKAEDFGGVFGERLASRLWGYSKIIEFEERDKRI